MRPEFQHVRGPRTAILGADSKAGKRMEFGDLEA
jgi:hypothetical protein